LAIVNNISIVLTCQTITRVRSGQGALLLPAISGSEWDNGISTQLVLFRDWLPKRSTQQTEEEAERWQRLRYAGVIKVRGIAMEENGRFDTVVPFSIEQVRNPHLLKRRQNTNHHSMVFLSFRPLQQISRSRSYPRPSALLNAPLKKSPILKTRLFQTMTTAGTKKTSSRLALSNPVTVRL